MRRLDPPTVRLILVTLTAVIVGIGVALVLGNIAYIGTHGGEDLHVYLEHTRHWLDGGTTTTPGS